jgi:Protein of unknown function (DUF3634)
MLRALTHWLQRLANPPLCSLEFVPEGVRCRRGSPPPSFVTDCGDVARELGIARGHLDVVGSEGRLQLRFSPELPARSHQRFRNVLGVHLAGLRPPRRRARR